MKAELEEQTTGVHALQYEVALQCWAAYLAFKSNYDECANERQRRERDLNGKETRLHADFALAPLVAPNNKPRYLTSQ